jgi:dihydroxyacid dehydratase/phosphogluconate dehydratase
LPGDFSGTRLGGVPDRKLRSNFTPGSTPWAMRRAQWSVLGLSDEDLEKPKIAIVNSSSQLASCFSHLDEVVGPLKSSIAAARTVDLEVSPAELDARHAKPPSVRPPPAGCGWLPVYARTVAPLGAGATLGVNN